MAKKNEVTDIRVNVKRPDRRSIFINGEFAFSLSEGVFIEKGIHVGDSLSDGELESIVDSEELQKMREAAANLLSYRPRSVKEMSDRLIRKGWEKEPVEQIIGELKEKRYLEDREFATIFARDRVKNKCLGSLALKSELFKKGVSKEIIAEAVAEIYEAHPPGTLIERLLRKRKISKETPISAKEKQRLVAMLRRKGFTWDQMEPFIRELKVGEGR
ncbi:MAG: RecX family transcriptional regulator [Candidatus Marinimicrobia bacterium]|jgi:regulatory protein|nr:RecX family transcriptional regulator [Candidatus Neomarinimicrobiota bacterium]MDP6594018.1 RecX family transcriptional regulator [Candidatus Neomarinimicrobiota bacterium]MDP6965683.1 RecX family transcriptional regulator [Candidatus Neomarinimicrobiota bacterium]